MQKQKGVSAINGIAIILAVALVAFGGVFAYQYFSTPKTSNQSQNPVACTQEAKICPDGSAVGRTGPNCEFATCPAVVDQTAGWKTYEWKFYDNIISFQYPSNWVVEKEYYLTPVEQIAGESPKNIGLLIYPKNNKTDNIHIAGRQNSCDPAQNHTRCESDEKYDVIFTDSKNIEILKVFDQIISTFKFTR